MDAITVGQLQMAIQRLKNKSSPGIDGWSPKNFKYLKEGMLEWLVSIFNQIEDIVEWPSEWLQAFVSMIPKGEEAATPADMRPITVAVAAYRLWASVRAAEVLDWQESWIFPTAFGFRRGRSAEDGAACVALLAENTRLSGTPFLAVCLDYTTNFDNINWDVFF